MCIRDSPNLLPEEVDEIMQNSVRPLGAPPKNNIYGTGRIDAMLCIANTPEQVQGHDVEMYKVLAPPDRIDPLTPLAPVVVVRNLGTHAESDITVHCKVDSMGTQVYHETLTVAQLELRDSDTATFPEWNVGPGGQTYNLTFWHAQASDTGRANDTIRQTTTTLGHDVRSIGMNIPARVRQNAPLVPRLTLSSGDYTEKNFRAFCRIDSAGEPVYRDSVLVDSVPQHASRTFAFPSAWNVGPKDAAYHVKMWHNCGPDQNRTNDTTTVTTVAIEQPRFLILYADYGAPDTTLGARLRALGDSVEYTDVRISTPGLDQLMPFDAVGALSNFTYFDNEALGDTLATYVDSGGGVVIGNLSFATGTRMAGRIMLSLIHI